MGGLADPRVLTGDALEIFRLGTGLHNQGNLAGAEAVYEEVLRRVPGNPDAQLRLGQVAVQSGRFEEALDWLGKAIATHPTAGAFAHRGDALQALGETAAALDSYDRAIALGPGAPARAICARMYCISSVLTVSQSSLSSQATSRIDACLQRRPT